VTIVGLDKGDHGRSRGALALEASRGLNVELAGRTIRRWLPNCRLGSVWLPGKEDGAQKRGLPKNLEAWQRGEHGVTADQRESFIHCLGSQDAIKRVAMIPW